jgi:RNA polymerase sigma-70 factor (ECF subfamily)
LTKEATKGAPTDEATRETERALVRRALAGDREAFDQIMETAAPALFRFASGRLNRDRETTREIVQATLVKVVENLDSFRGESRLLSWMCGICRFEILAHYRKKRHDAAHQEVDEASPRVRAALETAQGRPDDAPTRIERQERADLVHLVLDHLPSHYAQALEWKYIEGLPVQEIADRLEVGLKAAESILTRARGAFRATFDQLSHDPDLSGPASGGAP